MAQLLVEEVRPRQVRAWVALPRQGLQLLRAGLQHLVLARRQVQVLLRQDLQQQELQQQELLRPLQQARPQVWLALVSLQRDWLLLLPLRGLRQPLRERLTCPLLLHRWLAWERKRYCL